MVRPNILIVDDSAVIRHTIRKSLQQQFPHFELTLANNGREAQQLIGQQEFHLVLCDWEMPEMCGDELLIWLRQHPLHSRLPFVMVTSRTDPQWLHQATRLGVNNFVAKPFSGTRIAEIAAFELLRSGMPESVLNPPCETPAPHTVLRDVTPAKRATVPSPGKRPIPSGIWRIDHAQLQTVASSAERHDVRRLVVAEIRSQDERIRGLLEVLGTMGTTLIIPGGQAAPQLAEQVVLDIESPDNLNRLHINACVTHIAWTEVRTGVRMRCVDLVFLDEDHNKVRQVEELLDRICRTDGDRTGRCRDHTASRTEATQPNAAEGH